MKRTRLNIFILVTVVLLLQVVLPAIESVESDPGLISGQQFSVHQPRHSISPITLLKEKEETEGESEYFVVQLFQLIDFTNHTFLLSRFHKAKLEHVALFESIASRPALFTLHSVFLI